MKKILISSWVIILFLCSVSAGDTEASEVNVYLYNFKPFTFRFVNKLKKADEDITFRPSVETEIKNFKERMFTISLSLYDSEGKEVFTRSKRIERVENDNRDYIIVKFWLEDKIPFPHKAVVKVMAGKKSFQNDIMLEFVRIQGRVVGFDGSPRKDYLDVRDNGFENVYVACCDEKGFYEMILPKRTYNAIIVNSESYGTTTLENWTWSFTAYEDMELNFQIGELELYNLHAWPNNGGGPTLFVSFRPMSVFRANSIDKNKDGEISREEIEEARVHLSREAFAVSPFSGLSPVLDESKVQIFLDGHELKVVSVVPFPEYTGSRDGIKEFCTAYVVQALRERTGVYDGRHRVRVVIKDELEDAGKKVVERGEASYFWLQEGSIHAKAKYSFK